ncbi:hypothetical protein [Streptomyces swartbergensis]|uniref:hypothetical protein n=1 Tax=Streptomyces swartbergensis TaxID=487165 RepID=UPI003134376C
MPSLSGCSGPDATAPSAVRAPAATDVQAARLGTADCRRALLGKRHIEKYPELSVTGLPGRRREGRVTRTVPQPLAPGKAQPGTVYR